MTDEELARLACSRAWRFGRGDGSRIVAALRLLPGGPIPNSIAPNETSWRAVGGHLEFLDAAGRVTTTFAAPSVDPDGRVHLRGSFHGAPEVVHTLDDVAAPYGSAARSGARTAVLVRTHLINAKVWEILHSLYGSPLYDLYVLADETRGRLEFPGVAVVPHTVAMCKELGLHTDFATVLWKCGDFPIYCALQQIPDYDYYIQIEYDVYFVRQNPLFIEGIINRLGANTTAAWDLVIPYFAEVSLNWSWAEAAVKIYRPPYKGLFPFVVVSNRAARYLLEERRKESIRAPSESDTIHCEAFVGSALMAAGSYQCAALEWLMLGSIASDTFRPQMRSDYLLGSRVTDDPRIEMLHPVVDAKTYLERAFQEAVRGRSIRAFVARLDELDLALVPEPLRDEFRLRAATAIAPGLAGTDAAPVPPDEGIADGKCLEAAGAMIASLPEKPDAFVDAIVSLIHQNRFDIADAVAADASLRFPDSRAVWLQHAMVALHRGNPLGAARRLEKIRERFPDFAAAYSYGGMALRQAGYIEAAEALLNLAMARFPDESLAFIEYAQCGTISGPREEAIRRWQMVRDRFPDLPQGHWMLSNELVRVGKLDEAEAAIEQGISHFPDERFVLWQWGRTATQRHDWPEAVRRWEVAKSRHPDWGQIDEGIAEMHNAVRLGRIEDIQANEVAASVPMRMTADNAAGKLLMRFEGLGDNCEFGIVQRSAGVEPLGLLRWANISAAKLIAILDARFQGVGEEQNTRLDANDFGEYQLIDTRYFGMHTFINTGQATVEELMPKMLRRLRFLKEKLIEDLTEGEKIFVHKSVLAPLGLDEMRAVAAAIRRYGRGTLVCVQIPPVPEKDNCVERIEDGLFAGYLSKLTRNPLATRDYVDDWLRLCRAVEQLL